jgi:hypothetical protein
VRRNESKKCVNVILIHFETQMKCLLFNLIVRTSFLQSTSTNMIPVLRSIDTLLNRFDELSQRHANLLTNFDTNFSDIENPLRDVARAEEDQRKTKENILLAGNENDDHMGSIETIEDFHRRIIKNRYLHRPPSYVSTDSSVIHRVPSRTSSITTESTSLPRTSVYTPLQPIIKANTPQSVISTTRNDLVEPTIKPKFVPHNLPVSRRYARSAITAFTMDTVNRLSKPKTYHHWPEQKLTTKRVQQRSKPYENIKKNASECSAASTMRSTQIKRANPTTIKPSSKKFKVDHKVPIETLRRSSISNYSRPLAFLTPAPTICLTFPTQPRQQSSRIVILPKTTATSTTTTKKRSMIYSKT